MESVKDIRGQSKLVLKPLQHCLGFMHLVIFRLQDEPSPGSQVTLLLLLGQFRPALLLRGLLHDAVIDMLHCRAGITQVIFPHALRSPLHAV